ncbi:MAG: hypothetical protein N3H31_04860 [Candidatus Nezhaarchaeota archaeon]|nr:hypothetical protein [Candidatus Nezhaarchaeota archaeon]
MSYLRRAIFLTGIASMILIGALFDKYGRRFFVVFSYMLLGLGHALVSLLPSGLILYVLYPITDGFAWGALTALFTFVIWADISPPLRRAKYITIGIGTAILAVWLGHAWYAYALPTPDLSQLFGAASILFFLSGAMLYFIPETLPDRVKTRRAMERYIKRARELSGRKLG